MKLGFTIHNLNPRKSLSVGCIWANPDLKKTHPDFRAKKVMYAIAFDAYGPVAQVYVGKGQTVKGYFYCTHVLAEVGKHYAERRPRTGPREIKLLHDNASSHKTKQVAAYIT